MKLPEVGFQLEIYHTKKHRKYQIVKTKPPNKNSRNKTPVMYEISRKLYENHWKSTTGIKRGKNIGKNTGNVRIVKIKTSEKRLTLIENRLPDITNELEKMSKNQGSVDLELEEVERSIQEINDEKNIIDKKIESNDSKIKSVLDRQSELAGKKNVIDKKIQVLRDELNDAILTKSQSISQQKNIQSTIDNNIRRKKVIDNELTNLKQFSGKLSKVTSNKHSSSRDIELKISIDIIEHFSKNLYRSSTKAIEELVTNGYDAFAKKVHIFLGPKNSKSRTF